MCIHRESRSSTRRNSYQDIDSQDLIGSDRGGLHEDLDEDDDVELLERSLDSHASSRAVAPPPPTTLPPPPQSVVSNESAGNNQHPRLQAPASESGTRRLSECHGNGGGGRRCSAGILLGIQSHGPRGPFFGPFHGPFQNPVQGGSIEPIHGLPRSRGCAISSISPSHVKLTAPGEASNPQLHATGISILEGRRSDLAAAAAGKRMSDVDHLFK